MAAKKLYPEMDTQTRTNQLSQEADSIEYIEYRREVSDQEREENNNEIGENMSELAQIKSEYDKIKKQYDERMKPFKDRVKELSNLNAAGYEIIGTQAYKIINYDAEPFALAEFYNDEGEMIFSRRASSGELNKTSLFRIQK